MTQATAAQLLSEYFYAWVPSKGNPGIGAEPNKIPHVPTRTGALRLPTRCSPEEMQGRLDVIGFPRDFKFAWFLLPQPSRYSPEGARYTDGSPNPVAQELTAEQRERIARVVEERRRVEGNTP
jgi:hypothetical protein